MEAKDRTTWTLRLWKKGVAKKKNEYCVAVSRFYKAYKTRFEKFHRSWLSFYFAMFRIWKGLPLSPMPCFQITSTNLNASYIHRHVPYIHVSKIQMLPTLVSNMYWANLNWDALLGRVKSALFTKVVRDVCNGLQRRLNVLYLQNSLRFYTMSMWCCSNGK